MNVGFLGLGKMGKPMAINSLKLCRQKILFYVRRYEVKSEMEKQGAKAAASIEELIEQSEVCFIVLENEEQFRECLWRNNSLLKTISKGKLIVICSTLGNICVKEFADECRDRGAFVVDGPISGGVAKAVEGKLTMYLAGEERHCSIVKDIATAFAEKVFIVGSGQGEAQKIKLLNQLMVSVHMAATVEIYRLAEKANIDLETLYNALVGSAGNSVIFENRFPCLMKEDYTPRATVQTIWKDISLAAQTFDMLKERESLLMLVWGLFCNAKNSSLAKEDMSSIVKMYSE